MTEKKTRGIKIKVDTKEALEKMDEAIQKAKELEEVTDPILKGKFFSWGTTLTGGNFLILLYLLYEILSK